MSKLNVFLDLFIKQLKDPKKRLRFFLLSLAGIYLAWYFLLLNPEKTSKNELALHMQSLYAQQTTIQQQIEAIHQAIKTKSIAQAIAKQKELSTQVQHLQAQLLKDPPLLMTKEDWIQLKKEIINEQKDIDSNITLISMRDLLLKTWVPTDITKEDLMSTEAYSIEEYTLEIEFQADYFSTITYLARLEKLPRHVYWDSLQYKVLTYPKADITIKVHVFTKKAGET